MKPSTTHLSLRQQLLINLDLQPSRPSAPRSRGLQETASSNVISLQDALARQEQRLRAQSFSKIAELAKHLG